MSAMLDWHVGKDQAERRLTGMPASWSMESEVSVKSSENNALAVAAKLAAVGLKLFDMVRHCLKKPEGLLHPRFYLLGQQIVEGIDDILDLERKEAYEDWSWGEGG
jgi:hypothetical protein